MPKKYFVLIGISLVCLLVLGGAVWYRSTQKKAPALPVANEEVPQETIAPLDISVAVKLVKSSTQDNAVVLTVAGMGNKYQSVAYELTYDSSGLIKGVNSGSKPIDVAGKDTFEREVYMGTCSRNVCKPDTGVKTVTVALEFTTTGGLKSQFSKDFDL